MNHEAGKARFDKSKSRLTITLPVRPAPHVSLPEPKETVSIEREGDVETNEEGQIPLKEEELNETIASAVTQEPKIVEIVQPQPDVQEVTCNEVLDKTEPTEVAVPMPKPAIQLSKALLFDLDD